MRILTRIRLERARKLLSSTDTPLKEVAAIAGMPNVALFGSVFRAWFGVTPANFRRDARQAYMARAALRSNGRNSIKNDRSTIFGSLDQATGEAGYLDP